MGIGPRLLIAHGKLWFVGISSRCTYVEFPAANPYHGAPSHLLHPLFGRSRLLPYCHQLITRNDGPPHQLASKLSYSLGTAVAPMGSWNSWKGVSLLSSGEELTNFVSIT